MTTYDQRGLAPSASPRTDQVYVIRGRADFKKNPCIAGDSIQVADVPAGTLMLYSGTMVVRAEGAALTIDIGTTAAGNEIDDALDANTGAGTYLTGDTLKFEGNGLLEATAATTIFVTNEVGAADNAIIDVTILCAATTEDVIGS